MRNYESHVDILSQSVGERVQLHSDVEPTLLRMKCLMSMKRSPDMSPESKGEMNHEDTGEGRGNVIRKEQKSPQTLFLKSNSSVAVLEICRCGVIY